MEAQQLHFPSWSDKLEFLFFQQGEGQEREADMNAYYRKWQLIIF